MVFGLNTFATLLGSAGLLFFAWLIASPRKQWDPKGRHCYVTGGSAGLGLALSVLLTKKGAHVTVVARDEARLKKALEEMEASRQNPSQKLQTLSFSLIEEEASAAALEAACKPHGGKSPDAVFLCAGKSTPGFFVEQDSKTLQSGMNNGYWIQAYSALAAAKRMVKDKQPGKIVFVSSVLGYMSLVGYSSYSPAKFALKGLADTLRNELLLYSIGVHIYFPGTIFSPGYVEENKTKPKVTLKIEETDGGVQPEEGARLLLEGVQKNQFHIVSDFIGDIFRTTAVCISPRNNIVSDVVYAIIGWIALPIWRMSIDSTVRGHKAEHEAYLAAGGSKAANSH